MTLREKIAEIIAEAKGGETASTQCYGEADAILAAVREEFPKKKLPDDGNGDDDNQNFGFNAAIDEMKGRLS